MESRRICLFGWHNETSSFLYLADVRDGNHLDASRCDADPQVARVARALVFPVLRTELSNRGRGSHFVYDEG